MAARSVIVRLEAEVASYIAGMGRAAQATDNVARQAVNSRRSISDNADAMDKAGKTMMAFGTVSMAALGASAKAAMDWESAWAGVTKTVNGTPDEMRDLESSLRGLAKTLPSTHTEIAGVAEAAGQLGVARKDVVGFTKTMIDLGVSTNLTAEEAATNIAQISNVMGTMKREGSVGVERFGATLVALGNAGASTEAEILSMAQRIAGAGATVGASEVEVLALSNTLASMGVKAELGGGVTTRVLLKMYSAIQEGGPKLAAFAKTAGVSADEFAKKFADSPVAALDMVDKGLNRVKNEGGNVVQTMKDMGLKGTEETQVMLSLAASGDLLSDSLKLGNTSWQENTALVAEATKRYETTESKVKIAWNNIKDAAIDAGAAILPVVQGVAESVSGLAQTFGSLPAPVQSAVVILTGVVGAAALAGGALLTLTPKIVATRAAFATLNSAGSRIPAMFGGIAKGAGVALGAVIAFEAVKGIYNATQPATQGVEAFTNSLIGLGKQSGSMDEVFKKIEFGTGDKLVGQINNAGDAMKHLLHQDFNDATASFGATVLGIDNGMSKIADAVKKSDQAIAGAASSGHTEMAAKGFKAIADSAKAQGVEIEDTAKRFPQYKDALLSVAHAAGKTVTDTELLNWMMGKTPAAMEAAAAGGDKAAGGIGAAGDASGKAAPMSKELSDALAEIGVNADGTAGDLVKFADALLNAGLLNLSARDAARNYQEAIDAVSESITKNGTSLDIHTEKGRANQAALDAIAGSGMAVVQANAKNGESQEALQGNLNDTYNDLIAGAGQFGITGQAAIDLARDILKVPPGVSIESWMSSAAKTMAENTKAALGEIDGKTVNTYVNHHETTFIETVRSDSGANSGQGTSHDGRREAYASGGAIVGPGTSTSDEVLIAASSGEHMFDAGDVQKMGGQQAVYRFRAQLQAGQVPRFAEGGAIGRMSAARVLVNNTGISPTVTLEGLTVVVTNPFTGEQVRGVVQSVARQEAGAAVGAAGRDIARGSSV
ncbi:phage tail tape measure protein [Arthrobacter sp. B3I4]|uniref:phage tail tape measure protein n=1 Tax=Arthrobacter sp. B3I4 TaxID=3042267 RepID=UPI00277EDBF2|nr:phage tail tape measure protein [Arthrobacter sp. B3I4]MDQ0756069.1 TP901 family phage tail tape measure protein [Arthrobacter sp. B3I4]